jgi:enamine deaminase RidA (YjgF/YER057c/UK114 family)
MNIQSVQPEGWAPGKGYSNGMLVEGAARMLFVAGQIAWDEEQRLVGGGDLTAQFERALANAVAVVEAAGGAPENIVRLTLYVKDKRDYLERGRAIGEAYRRVMGRHFPAMSLVQVADLLEEGALVEIEATAALS